MQHERQTSGVVWSEAFLSQKGGAAEKLILTRLLDHVLYIVIDVLP
jgi:hypothetical protein